MKFISEFFKIPFEHEDSKTAYLMACKWLAKYVIGKNDITDVTFSIEKVKDVKIPRFEVILFVTLDNGEFKEHYCNKCKDFHKSFYVNENYNCNSCKMLAYTTQAKSKLKIKEQWRKERIDLKLKPKEDY